MCAHDDCSIVQISSFMPRDERYAELLDKERMQIGLPTLFVHGSEDQLVPLAQGEKLSGNFLNKTMLVHHGAHYVPACSGETKQSIVRFLVAAADQQKALQI